MIGWRDLEWRQRRLLVTVVATGIVFALALLMTGIKASFDNEIERTVASIGADRWLVAAGSIGPFTAPAGFPASQARGASSSAPRTVAAAS